MAEVSAPPAAPDAAAPAPDASARPDWRAWAGRLRTPGPLLYGAIAGAVALLAAIVAALLWAGGSDYQPLYRGLSEADAGQVMEALQKANVPFRVDRDSGALAVPAERVHETRLKLAAQGLPRGAVNGFELLDQHNGLGQSQFMENARYQRALEGELARSVMSIGAVANARVHLAVPKESVFVRNRQSPSASVLLQLQPGRVLDPGQVAAIVHLVSSSVPKLTADQVAVVDQSGNLLTRPAGSGGLGLNLDQMEFQQRLESTYVRRIEDLLSPIVGSGRVRAQVALDLDFAAREETSEAFDPRRDPGMMRSEQSLEEYNGRPNPQGIPGALSNQPPGVATAPEQAGAANPPAAGAQGGPQVQGGGQGQLPLTEAQREADASRQGRVRRELTRNYELDKRVSHVRNAPGQVRRVSVAVVLDDPIGLNEAGEAARLPFKQEQLDRFTALVREAVGFDAQRGDTVNVMNATFANTPFDPNLLPMWRQDWFLELVKWAVIGIVAVLFLLLVVRPLMKRLLPPPPAPVPPPAPPAAPPALAGATGQALAAAAAEAGDADAGAGELAEDRLELSSRATQAPRLANEAAAALDEQIRQARLLVAEDPKRAVQVLRAWMELPAAAALAEARETAETEAEEA